MPRLMSFSLKTSSAAATRSSVSACSVTPASPAHSMVALVPRKSNRCDSSLPAWLRALSISWRSTLLTTSKDASAMAHPFRWAGRPLGLRERRPPFLYSSPVPPHGGLPEWPMGADCKSVGLAYEGSNPSPATPRYDGPRPSRSGAVCTSGERRRPRAGRRGPLERFAAEEQPAEGDVDVAGAADGHLGAVGLPGPGVQARSAVGELIGDRRLRRRPRQRQLRTDPLGVDDGLVGAVGRGERGAVADRLQLLLFQERVG